MSLDALNWVITHSPYSGRDANAYLVHLLIADSVNSEHDLLFWMRQQKLANKARLKRQTLNQLVRKLVDDGYLELVEDRTGNGRDDANLYRFVMREDEPLRYSPKTRSGLPDDSNPETPQGRPAGHYVPTRQQREERAMREAGAPQLPLDDAADEGRRDGVGSPDTIAETPACHGVSSADPNSPDGVGSADSIPKAAPQHAVGSADTKLVVSAQPTAGVSSADTHREPNERTQGSSASLRSAGAPTGAPAARANVHSVALESADNAPVDDSDGHSPTELTADPDVSEAEAAGGAGNAADGERADDGETPASINAADLENAYTKLRCDADAQALEERQQPATQATVQAVLGYYLQWRRLWAHEVGKPGAVRPTDERIKQLRRTIRTEVDRGHAPRVIADAICRWHRKNSELVELGYEPRKIGWIHTVLAEGYVEGGEGHPIALAEPVETKTSGRSGTRRDLSSGARRGREALAAVARLRAKGVIPDADDDGIIEGEIVDEGDGPRELSHPHER